MGALQDFTCSELGVRLVLGVGKEKTHKDYLSLKVRPLGQQPGTEASIAPGGLQVAQHLGLPDGEERVAGPQLLPWGANNLIREKGVILKGN